MLLCLSRKWMITHSMTLSFPQKLHPQLFVQVSSNKNIFMVFIKQFVMQNQKMKIVLLLLHQEILHLMIKIMMNFLVMNQYRRRTLMKLKCRKNLTEVYRHLVVDNKVCLNLKKLYYDNAKDYLVKLKHRQMLKMILVIKFPLNHPMQLSKSYFYSLLKWKASFSVHQFFI